MNKGFYILAALLAISGGSLKAQLGFWSSSSAIAYDEAGKGTSANNPILIESEGHLVYLAQKVNGTANYSLNKYFKLTKDLDLGAHYWIPIGDAAHVFAGRFDGNGKTIKKVFVYSDGTAYRGLFGNAGTATFEIKNLTVADCNVPGVRYTGGLIGYCSGGSVSGCSVSGTVSGLECVGGLIGVNSAAVSDCHATGVVKGMTGTVGGLIGDNSGPVSDCYAVSAVTGTESIGGLLGFNGASVSGCYAAGMVSGLDFVGGLIGYCVGNNSRVSDCFSASVITGDMRVGGLIGGNELGAVTGCYAANTVRGGTLINSFTGSIVGYARLGAITSCLFDIQGTGQITGVGVSIGYTFNVPAATLASGNLPAIFNPAVWTAAAGYYPQLKKFAESNRADDRIWSGLSVIPITPATVKERTDSVCTVFRLAEKTASGDPVAWSVSSDGKADIFDGRVNSDNVDGWDMLTLDAGGRKRQMIYRPKKAFSTPFIKYTLGDQTFEDPDAQVKVTTDCNASGNMTLTVSTSSLTEVTIAGQPIRTTNIDVSKPGIMPRTITAKTVDGAVAAYELVVERPFPTGIFEQRWADVLAVNNNFSTNDGFTFSGYEWYKDGTKMPGTKGYIQEPGGLSKTAKYTAVLTTQQGDKISTCPAVIAASPVKMAAWPNPARRGQTVRADTGIAAEALSGAAVQLFGPSGNIVAKQNLRDPVAEIAMPDTPGQYLLQVTTADGTKQTFKIAVE